jgi:hypothetical protein
MKTIPSIAQREANIAYMLLPAQCAKHQQARPIAYGRIVRRIETLDSAKRHPGLHHGLPHIVEFIFGPAKGGTR